MNTFFWLLRPFAFLLIGACAPSSSSSEPIPFQFRTSSIVPLKATVTLDLKPLPSCLIQVRAGQAGDTLYTGATNAKGVINTDLKWPSEVEYAVVTAQHPQSTGDHTDNDAKQSMGSFAPSARIVIPVEDLAQTVINLTSEIR